MLNEKFLDCISEKCGSYVVPLLSNIKSRICLYDILHNCNFVDDEDDGIKLTSLGYWFLAPSSHFPITFMSSGKVLAMPKSNNGISSVFLSFLGLNESFLNTVKRYEDRSNMVRRSLPEVSLTSFWSCLAISMSRTDLIQQRILIEQLDALFQINISYFSASSSYKKASLDVIHFLQYYGVVDWHYSGVVSQLLSSGTADFEKGTTGSSISIRYETSPNKKPYFEPDLSSSDNLILSLAKNKEHVNHKIIKQNLGLSDRTISRSLSTLWKLGKLKTFGGAMGKKNTKYRLALRYNKIKH